MSVPTITYTVYDKGSHRRILFEGTDHLAVVHQYGPVMTYDVAYDPETTKEAIRVKMEGYLGENEVERWMEETEAPITTVHATKAQYAAAIREAYRNAEKEELYRVAYKLYSRYQAGDFTAAQLMTAFNMTGPELTTFANTKLIPYHDAWVVMQTAVAE